VGKTTVARTLLDYFVTHQVAARAFDTEVPRGTLKRFHPNLTDVIDVALVADQMKIFDTLNSSVAAVTVIDVRAGLMSPTLKALRDIGFIEAAKNGNRSRMRSKSSFRSLTKWRPSRWNWRPRRISPSSTTRSRAGNQPPTRSCCEAMFDTGWARSAPSMTGSVLRIS
jgi:hypothetical protein